VLAVALSTALGMTDDFSPYEVILRRQPFGKPSPEPSVADKKATQPAAPPFVQDLRMCAITDTAFGVRVGIVNLAVKPPKSYYLRLGESEDGIELVEADYEEEAALLRKGSEEHWIYMSGKEGGTPPPSSGRGSRPATKAPGIPATGRRAIQLSRIKRRHDLLMARRKREEEIEKAGVEGVEELKKQIREYNMDLIRAGGELGPPLPIPLNREEDDQLVAEGVLPPTD